MLMEFEIEIEVNSISISRVQKLLEFVHAEDAVLQPQSTD